METGFEIQHTALALVAKRFSFLPSHEALFLLKSSLPMPRLLHVLHSADCNASAESVKFDIDLRNAFSVISNTSLDDTPEFRPHCQLDGVDWVGAV